jgi:hypothetical protein
VHYATKSESVLDLSKINSFLFLNLSGHVLTDQDISGHRHLYVGFHLPGKRLGHGHKDSKEGKGGEADKGGELAKNGSVFALFTVIINDKFPDFCP